MKKTNISNKRNIVKNHNQLAIYKALPRIWARDYRETNPAVAEWTRDLRIRSDYNTSALNHSATLPPLWSLRQTKIERQASRHVP